MTPSILPGRPHPLGAVPEAGGTNFALFSERADRVELCLFDAAGTETRLTLPECSGGIHHGFVPNAGAGQRYGYRVYGQNDAAGAVFNPQKLLIDPYARRLDGIPQYRNEAELARFRSGDPHDNAAVAPKSVVCADSDFDWQGDRLPETPWAQTVIYEAHVKGLSRLFPELAAAGTYAALADARLIAHLQDLGITAVELLPVQQHLPEYHLQCAGRQNYWGYNTYAPFAVEPRYAARPEQAADELRRAVRALHAAGIEVILDVVFNHTAEQDGAVGLMLCQRGIDAPSWYWLQPESGTYINWSGCGNTLNTATPAVARWVADNLRYWAEQFHIDGFRFDLAAVLGREPDFRSRAALLQILAQDPLLARRKLIAEPWDLGAGGQCGGAFPAPFAEWNDAFRDDIRAFWLWESGRRDLFAERMAGSANRFRHSGRRPAASVNFISAHDGFTLHDLTAYNHKHNHANGEQNRDGSGRNISYNHGAEGLSTQPEILSARRHSAKALLATLLLANGTPMLLGGDEFGNSQQGNNNGYCQDNETTWLDWPAYDADLAAYTRALIRLRRRIALLAENVWLDGRVQWLDSSACAMSTAEWNDPNSKAMQIVLDGGWLLLVNGKRSGQDFTLPALPPPQAWRLRLAPDCTAAAEPAASFHTPHMGIWIFQAAADTPPPAG